MRRRSPLSPAVRRIVAEEEVDVGQRRRRPGRAAASPRATSWRTSISRNRRPAPPRRRPRRGPAAPAPAEPPTAGRETRQRMSGLRQKIAQRLVEAQHTAAILTTFNEADMSRVMDLRAQYKEPFQKKHGVALGFMSFFIKAAIEALKAFPAVNGRIDGNEIVYHNYLRHRRGRQHRAGADGPGHPRRRPAARSPRSKRRSPASRPRPARGRSRSTTSRAGTFTITNGGIFGSLLSTPILNPPQSGILGMHAIKKRPVVVDDQIVIRPMMYLALSYDHRLDRRPRGGQLPGQGQGLHREPRAVVARGLIE